MNYQIIARKYRPKNFSEVIGQKKIITILLNALKKNRIGQAYLFSGPRGVGKTTTARILVKYLNCEAEENTIPCNQCQSCNEINRGVSLDYLEIDGASNRGIDQIRALNEQLTFSSPTGKYRVFVIDEVHMLTTEAFNALLKSLEEPPNRVIFVLCTTESYRIPLTIRSRCQQLFFTNIDPSLIEGHLEAILKKEDISFSPHSLWDLARKSEGSIRDAENLLEKIIAFNDDRNITTSIVQEVLGDAPTDKKYLFLTHLNEENLKANLELTNQLSADGYDLNEFFHSLISTLSNLVYYKSGVQDHVTLGINSEELEQLKPYKKLFSLHEIFTLTDILFDFIRTLKNTTHHGTMIQYLLIKLHRYRNLISPGELKENILKLSHYTHPDTSLNIPKKSTSPESNEPIVVHLSTKPRKEENGKEESLSSNKPSAKETPDILNTAQSSPQENLQSSLSNTQTLWTEKDYQILLQTIESSDISFFQMAAAFPFLKMEGEYIILENRNNMSPDKIENFKQQFEEYLNQATLKSHPQLSELIAGRHFKIIIQKNIKESNLEKIQKILPLEE